MKVDLKKWNEEDFGNIGKQKRIFWLESVTFILLRREDPYLMLKCGEKISWDLEVYFAQRNLLAEKVKGFVVEKGR
jgi:hypothetical protein